MLSDNSHFTFEITSDDLTHYKRLDQYLSSKFPELSRSFIKNLFSNNQINYCNNQKLDKGIHLKKLELKRMPIEGSIVEIIIPPKRPADAIPENLPLKIIFEDEHLVIINKEAGMVTHPAPGNYEGTLVNAILYHCPDLKGIGDSMRPGIVHRLDKGTSGIMVVAKDQITHRALVNLFSEHNIERKYEALVMGNKFPDAGTLSSTIGRHPKNRLKMAANIPHAKNATTHFLVLERFLKLSHFELKLETGRTHQIRVHLSSLLKAPILMDSTYGNPKQDLSRLEHNITSLIKDYPYPFLHAKVLGFTHPITKEKLHFEEEPPKLFQDILKLVRQNS